MNRCEKSLWSASGLSSACSFCYRYRRPHHYTTYSEGLYSRLSSYCGGKREIAPDWFQLTHLVIWTCSPSTTSFSLIIHIHNPYYTSFHGIYTTTLMIRRVEKKFQSRESNIFQSVHLLFPSSSSSPTYARHECDLHPAQESSTRRPSYAKRRRFQEVSSHVPSATIASSPTSSPPFSSIVYIMCNRIRPSSCRYTNQ